MNKLHAFGLLIVLDALVGQAHLVSDNENVYGVSLLFQQFMLACFIFYIVDYKSIVLTSLAAAFALSELTDIALFIYTDFSTMVAVAIVDAALFILWGIGIIFRSYDKSSVEPEQDTIYLISKKPDNFWTFIPSLFPYYSDGTSGYSILCNGARYGFSHGSFKIIDFESQDYKFVTATSIKYKPELINYLATKQGAKWTLFDNCVTVHFKLKWMDWHV